MKHLVWALFFLCFGACSSPKADFVALPDKVHALTMDSIDSGVLLNANGMVATSDYLIVSNLSRDTIFDVFDIRNLNYLYSDLIYGQAANDMGAFRWVRHLEGNRFYTVGLGFPLVTKIEASGKLDIKERQTIEWEKDICQNVYLLSGNKVLIQPGKKNGEWSLHDTKTKETVDMPETPFIDEEPDGDMIAKFQNRAANIAIKGDKSRIAFFYYKLPYMRLLNSKGDILKESCVGKYIDDASGYFHKEKTPCFTGCAFTDEFIFVKYNPEEQEEGTTYFQVWDWEGNLLHLFQLKEKFNVFTVSADGKTLYAVKGDNDHIFRCDLTGLME